LKEGTLLLVPVKQGFLLLADLGSYPPGFIFAHLKAASPAL